MSAAQAADRRPTSFFSDVSKVTLSFVLLFLLHEWTKDADSLVEADYDDAESDVDVAVRDIGDEMHSMSQNEHQSACASAGMRSSDKY